VSLVDSIKKAKATVGEAFDQLAADVEADEAGTDTPTPPTVEKVTVTYSDGSSADFAPPGSTGGVTDAPDEVKDLTEEAPAEGEKSGDESPQAPPVDTPPPGNSEQV
jgi:hypothetical protein